jgi:1-deoxy-D-xylulose 5-phosphate reductoisomerase
MKDSKEIAVENLVNHEIEWLKLVELVNDAFKHCESMEDVRHCVKSNEFLISRAAGMISEIGRRDRK